MRGFRVVHKKLNEEAALESLELRSVLKFDVRRALKQYGMFLEETKYDDLRSTAAKAAWISTTQVTIWNFKLYFLQA